MKNLDLLKIDKSEKNSISSMHLWIVRFKWSKKSSILTPKGILVDIYFPYFSNPGRLITTIMPLYELLGPVYTFLTVLVKTEDKKMKISKLRLFTNLVYNNIIKLLFLKHVHVHLWNSRLRDKVEHLS